LAERIRRVLERGDPLELVAEANAFLEECGLGRVIVVGGYAVELYSGGAYRTGDVDVIVEGGGALLKRALGLIEEWRERVWVHRALSYAIDIVGSHYSKPKQPVTLEVGGKRVYVEPPEECIVSALAACVYWGSDLDCEKAAMVMAAQWDAIDWEYLERRCAEEGVAGKLAEVKRVVESVRGELLR
jgi:hypothetical protein